MLGANPVAETISGFLNFVRIMIIKQRYVCTLLLAIGYTFTSAGLPLPGWSALSSCLDNWVSVNVYAFFGCFADVAVIAGFMSTSLRKMVSI